MRSPVVPALPSMNTFFMIIILRSCYLEYSFIYCEIIFTIYGYVKGYPKFYSPFCVLDA